MSVKTDLQWPTLGDERSDSKDVSEFYDHFEDNCGLANSCKGMNYREMLLALRSRCRGSRLKTFTNLYKSAYRAGEIEKDPEKVYKRIKAKHLMFSESPEEREIRVDAEHVALAKGKMTGHQFEPLFEASVTELETVGLGKSKRELYLSYLRKMPAHLQKEIRSDKRLWAGETQLRGPQTWEEAHRVVLEVEQREATHRATECCLLHGDGEATATSEEGAKETEGAKGAEAAGFGGHRRHERQEAVFPLQGSWNLSVGRQVPLLPRQGASEKGAGGEEAARGERISSRG